MRSAGQALRSRWAQTKRPEIEPRGDSLCRCEWLGFQMLGSAQEPDPVTLRAVACLAVGLQNACFRASSRVAV